MCSFPLLRENFTPVSFFLVRNGQTMLKICVLFFRSSVLRIDAILSTLILVTFSTVCEFQFKAYF